MQLKTKLFRLTYRVPSALPLYWYFFHLFPSSKIFRKLRTSLKVARENLKAIIPSEMPSSLTFHRTVYSFLFRENWETEFYSLLMWRILRTSALCFFSRDSLWLFHWCVHTFASLPPPLEKEFPWKYVLIKFPLPTYFARRGGIKKYAYLRIVIAIL